MPSSNVPPHLTLLTDAPKQQAHRHAPRILSETGEQADAPAVLGQLRPQVGSNGVDGSLVRLPAKLITAARRPLWRRAPQTRLLARRTTSGH